MSKQSNGATVAEASSVAPDRTAAERWLAEYDEALRSSNEFVQEHGVPLQRYSCIPEVVALALKRKR